MSARWESLVPEGLHGATRDALAAAYGTAAVQCAEVTGGASGAVAFCVTSGPHRHLLRVEARRTPMRNPHQYACMATAAEAGIAPPLHYVDAENGIALMDFVEAVPLDRFPNGDTARAAALGELARRLQETPPFPSLGDWRAIVGRLLSLLESRAAPGLLDPHRAAFEHLHATVSWDEGAHVSSHNDPNARNVLFDGTRLWLIDWETAYLNDPMVDVAILADNLAATPELTGELLRAWLGRAASDYDTKRLQAIRRLTRLYYAGLLIGFGAPPGTRIDSLSVPPPAEIAAQQARGKMTEITAGNLLVAGKMCLAAFLDRAE